MRPTSSTLRIWGRPRPGVADEVGRRDPVVDVGHLDRLDALVAELADVLADGDALEGGPGSFSTMKAEMPSAVRAARATMPARSPLVTQALVPLTTYSSPSGIALHEMLRVSLPASGSESERAPRRSPAAMVGQPALLLLLGAVRHDQGGRHGVGVDDAGEAHPPVGQLLDDADVGEQVETEAAVGLGDGHAEEPDLAHLRHQLRREPVLVLELGGDRDDLLRDEAPDRPDDLLADVGVGGGGLVGGRLVHLRTLHSAVC